MQAMTQYSIKLQWQCKCRNLSITPLPVHKPINNSILQVQEPINIFYQSIAPFYKCRNLSITPFVLPVHEPINSSISAGYKFRNNSPLFFTNARSLSNFTNANLSKCRSSSSYTNNQPHPIQTITQHATHTHTCTHTIHKQPAPFFAL